MFRLVNLLNKIYVFVLNVFLDYLYFFQLKEINKKKEIFEMKFFFSYEIDH
jgi:hypothetical protein